MKAKIAFDFNLERACNLLNLYHRQRNAGVAHKEIDDLLRASIVLAVGSLDAYVHDRISEELVPFIKRALKQNSNDLDPLEKALKEVHTRDYLSWLTQKRPFVQVRRVIDSQMSRESLQHPGSIHTAFSLIGKKSIWPQCAALLKRKEKDLSDQLTFLTRRRNQIVHEGDREKSRLKKHQQRAIDAEWVREQLDFVEQLADAIERSASVKTRTKKP
jgi:hypothetical protein